MVTIIKKGTPQKEIKEVFEKLRPSKAFNAKKYCGTVALERDAIAIQKALRDEWK